MPKDYYGRGDYSDDESNSRSRDKFRRERSPEKDDFGRDKRRRKTSASPEDRGNNDSPYCCWIIHRYIDQKGGRKSLFNNCFAVTNATLVFTLPIVANRKTAQEKPLNF